LYPSTLASLICIGLEVATIIVGTHCKVPSHERDLAYYLCLCGDQAHAAMSHQIDLSKPIISMVVNYREWLIECLFVVFFSILC
jgi:hypothetical protein